MYGGPQVSGHKQIATARTNIATARTNIATAQTNIAMAQKLLTAEVASWGPNLIQGQHGRIWGSWFRK